jgi:MFS family permease
MQVWALLWHIRSLSDQPIVVSGIGVVRFLPILVFSLVAGLVADLFDRRAIMALTQTSMALVALCLAWLTLTGQIRVWHIYLLTAIQAVAISFDLPARQALVPNLVPHEILPSAFSMQSIAFDLGAIIGPALSGLVIGYMGQYAVYVINAISFVAVLVALFLMGPVPQPVVADRKKAFSFNSLTDGACFIWKRPIIFSSMILDFFATFFSSANTLLPFVARDILKVGPVPYGWLSAAQSIGAVSAGVVISQRTVIRRQGALLLGAVGVFGLATTLFGLSRSFVLTMVILVLVGAGDSVSTIIRNTVRQMQTPDAMRGRMVSINQIFFSGGPQLGEIEAGLAAQAFGTPVSIVIGGIGCLLVTGFIAWRWPQLRRYNGDEPLLSD